MFHCPVEINRGNSKTMQKLDAAAAKAVEVANDAKSGKKTEKKRAADEKKQLAAAEKKKAKPEPKSKSAAAKAKAKAAEEKKRKSVWDDDDDDAVPGVQKAVVVENTAPKKKDDVPPGLKEAVVAKGRREEAKRTVVVGDLDDEQTELKNKMDTGEDLKEDAATKASLDAAWRAVGIDTKEWMAGTKTFDEMVAEIGDRLKNVGDELFVALRSALEILDDHEIDDDTMQEPFVLFTAWGWAMLQNPKRYVCLNPAKPTYDLTYEAARSSLRAFVKKRHGEKLREKEAQ